MRQHAGSLVELELPPILSPTLPSDWDPASELDLPSEPLSPSLPPDYCEPAESRRFLVTLKLPQGDAASYKMAHRRVKFWNERARETKHAADKAARDNLHRLAALQSLDAIACFILAFLWEEKGEHYMSQPLHARSWNTLLPYLRKTASYLGSLEVDLIGLIYQVSAIVEIRVASHNRTSVDHLWSAVSNFRRGITLLPLHILQEKYHLGHWTKAQLSDPPKLSSDKAVLPLHVNSDPQEAACLLYRIGVEWAAQEGLKYSWRCTLPT